MLKFFINSVFPYNFYQKLIKIGKSFEFFKLVFKTNLLKGYACLFAFYTYVNGSFQNWKLQNFEASSFLHFIIMIWLFFGALPTESSVIFFFWTSLIILAFLVIFFSGLKLFLEYLGFWTLETFIRTFIFFNVLIPLFLTFYIEIFYGIFLLFFSAFLLRISYGSLIALLYLFFISLVCLATPLNQESNFNDVFKKYLPFVLFYLLLISLSYLLARINLQYSLLLPIIYNYQIIKDYYKNTWVPRILHSSFIWNLFRLCTPAPLFLFGLEGLALNGLFGILSSKLQSATGFSRFLQIPNKPSFLQSNTLTFYHTYNTVLRTPNLPIIAQFIEKVGLRFLIEQLVLTKKQGYPSEVLKNALKSWKSTDLKNFEKFLLLNTKFFESREFLHFIFLSILKPDQAILPTVLVYPQEGLLLLPKSSTEKFEKLPQLLMHLYIKQAVTTPLIFVFKGHYYLSLNEDPETLYRFEEEAILNILNAKLAQKELFYHSFKGLHGHIYARFSTHDFFLINAVTGKVSGTVSAKSSFLDQNVWQKATFFSIIQVENDNFTFKTWDPVTLTYITEDFKISEFISNEVSFPLERALKNFHMIDQFMLNKDALRATNIEMATHLILNNQTTLMTKFQKEDI